MNLAQADTLVTMAVNHGLTGVLALVVSALASGIVWLYRERLKLEKAHKDEISGIRENCRAEMLRLAAEYRDKTETLLREQIQIIASNNMVLRETADVIRRSRGRNA